MTEATFEERLQAVEARLNAKVERLEQERDEYKKLAGLLQEQVERLKRGLLGQKAERLPKNDAQLSLALLNLALGGDAAAAEPAAPEPKQTVPEHTRRKPVRKPLPEGTERVVIDIIPPEVQLEGEENFEHVGVEGRDVLERRPAATVIVELNYHKYVRKDRKRNAPTEVLCAPAVELPIERGVAGPSMLADTIVRRWQDHQPLNRLEEIYRRERIELAKSTLCTWHDKLAELVQPLVDAMFEDAYRAPYLCVDATGVLVQAPEKAETVTSGCSSHPANTCSTATRRRTTPSNRLTDHVVALSRRSAMESTHDGASHESLVGAHGSAVAAERAAG